jgi:DNA recombination protein RmuC
MAVFTLLLGIALGASGAWLVVRALASAREAALEERAAALDDARAGLENAFKALSADALRSNNESFLQLARAQLEQRERSVEQLVGPIRESLQRVDGQIQAAEHARRQAFGALSQQLESLAHSQERLRAETGNLTTALRAPHVRGRWGEVQLKNVVEVAGMIEHCDFELQTSTRNADGSLLRPDLVVRLPGGKHVVVDAKVPLDAFLDGTGADSEEEGAAHLRRHARQLRQHVDTLAGKGYWRALPATPEFVVLFVPGDAFLAAALDRDADLLEYAFGKRIHIATPTTLISTLRTCAYAWQQEALAENAREVFELGRELYSRISKLGAKVDTLGKRLGSAVGAYNDTVASLESRSDSGAPRT